jgi:hypothetical protein
MAGGIDAFVTARIVDTSRAIGSKIHDAVISPTSDTGLILPLGLYLFRIS